MEILKDSSGIIANMDFNRMEKVLTPAEKNARPLH